MSQGLRSSTVISATELARLCQVDVKTIHHWAQRDTLPHFRTPGRHLRFQADDVVDFLRRYGYDVPTWLVEDGPTVLLLTHNVHLRERWVKGLMRRFSLRQQRDPYGALIDLGENPSDALVVDLATLPDPRSWLTSVLGHESTRRCRTIAVTHNELHVRAAGEAGTLVLPSGTNVSALRRTLSAVLRTRA